MAYETLNFARGLNDGMNSAFNLLDKVAQRKRQKVLQAREDEAYGYDLNTLRPLRERELVSSINYNERARPKQLQITDNTIEQGSINNNYLKQANPYRIGILANQSEAGQLANTHAKNVNGYKVQAAANVAEHGRITNNFLNKTNPYRRDILANQAKSGQLANNQSNDKHDYWKTRTPIVDQQKDDKHDYWKTRRPVVDKQNDRVNNQTYNTTEINNKRKEEQQQLAEAEALKGHAFKLFEQGKRDEAIKVFARASELTSGIYDRFMDGAYTQFAGTAQKVSMGEMSPDSPEFKRGVREFMTPTMNVTGRSKDYSAAGLRPLGDGRSVPVMMPKSPKAIGQRLAQLKVGGKVGQQLTAALPKVAKYNDLIEELAAKYGVDDNLVRAVITAESGGDVKARSKVRDKKTGKMVDGAQGLMQLMPATARELGVSDAFDPAQNIEGGIKYLAQMLKRHNGDVELALAAYNAGPGNVDKYKGVPPFKETQQYVKRVSGYYGVIGKMEVPATVGRSSDKNDPVVALGQAQMSEAAIGGAKQEADFLSQMPKGFEQAYASYRAQVTKANAPKTADWVETKKGGSLLNKRTGEVKAFEGDGGAFDLVQWSKDNLDSMGGLKVEGVAAEISQRVGHLSPQEQMKLLNNVNQEGAVTPDQLNALLSPIEFERDSSELAQMLVSGVDDPELLRTELGAGYQQLHVSAKQLIDDGLLTAKQLGKIAEKSLKTVGDGNQGALLNHIGLQLRLIEQEAAEKAEAKAKQSFADEQGDVVTRQLLRDVSRIVDPGNKYE